MRSRLRSNKFIVGVVLFALVLHSFAAGDGENPQAGLVRDSSGNLYGTTLHGGTSGQGTVFKVDTTGKETVLYSFTNGTDGGSPYAALVMDKVGNLYSTTSQGGTFGAGTVFKLERTGKETVLYNFCSNNCADGALPLAGLVQDSAGNLYGTTFSGGTYQYGTVFKLDPTGMETVLYNFTNAADGGSPYAGLFRDSSGNLYGTAWSGGTYGFGTVYKITP